MTQMTARYIWDTQEECVFSDFGLNRRLGLKNTKKNDLEVSHAPHYCSECVQQELPALVV